MVHESLVWLQASLVYCMTIHLRMSIKNQLSNWLLHTICIWIVALCNQECRLREQRRFHHCSWRNASSVFVFSASSSLCSLVEMNQCILLLQYCVTEDSQRYIESLLWKHSTTNLISREMFASGWIWIFSMNTVGMKMIPFNNISGMFCITHKLLSEWQIIVCIMDFHFTMLFT